MQLPGHGRLREGADSTAPADRVSSGEVPRNVLEAEGTAGHATFGIYETQLGGLLEKGSFHGICILSQFFKKDREQHVGHLHPWKCAFSKSSPNF